MPKRNDPCPCGSGKKYKKCCMPVSASPTQGLRPGVRMKGGVLYDEDVGGFMPIVHTWDNVACEGDPEEWRSERVFPSEEEAMAYYKMHIRPGLQEMMASLAAKAKDATFIHREME